MRKFITLFVCVAVCGMLAACSIKLPGVHLQIDTDAITDAIDKTKDVDIDLTDAINQGAESLKDALTELEEVNNDD